MPPYAINYGGPAGGISNLLEIDDPCPGDYSVVHLNGHDIYPRAHELGFPADVIRAGRHLPLVNQGNGLARNIISLDPGPGRIAVILHPDGVEMSELKSGQ